MEDGATGCLRAYAPDVAALFRWPDDFGTRYTIFVDTEEEFDWDRPFDRANRAVTAASAIPAAAVRFARMGASLTFLVDHPIASDPAAIDAVQRAMADSGADVGAQLHPWVTPPFDEPVNGFNSFAGNLAPPLEVAKIASLTDVIRSAFDRSPRIFRAGRYGLGYHTLDALRVNGYRIDSSMRARYDYSPQGGPDFSAIGNRAFRVGDILELPLTTIYTGMLRRMGPYLHPLSGRIPRGIGLLARSGLLQRVALTPEGMPVADALEAIRVVLGEGLPLLNLSFHSPSLVPGHTPYVRDAADLTQFWTWWDRVLGLRKQRGVRSARAEDLLACV